MHPRFRLPLATLALLVAVAPGPARPGAAAAASAAKPAAGKPAAPRVLPFISDDYPKAVAEARARKVPLFIESWAPW